MDEAAQAPSGGGREKAKKLVTSTKDAPNENSLKPVLAAVAQFQRATNFKWLRAARKRTKNSGETAPVTGRD